jgi:hypothetical protein
MLFGPGRKTTQTGCFSSSLFLAVIRRLLQFCSRPLSRRITTLKKEGIFRLGWLWATLFALTGSTSGETIRVTSWNLSNWSAAAAISGSNRLDIASIAAELRRLDPDVILLQHLQDPDACVLLTQALKPLDYHVTVCSSFGLEPLEETKLETGRKLQELKLSYETQIRRTSAELDSTEKQLAESRTALGGVAEELIAQGITNWSEVTPDSAIEYSDISRQIEMLVDQERDLRRRGYKEAHPLVQAVRTQLRMFSTRKAELDRTFPTLKYFVVSTNEPNWTLARQLDQNRALNLRVAVLRQDLKDNNDRLSQLIEGQGKTVAFADETRSGVNPGKQAQLAILSKQEAYFALSHPWAITNIADSGGLAFAALQTSKRRLGFFSVDFGSADTPDSVQQLLAEIGSIRKWEQNQVEVFLLVGTFGNSRKRSVEDQNQAMRVLLRAGFSDALADLTGEQREADASRDKFQPDWILVENVGLSLNPQVANGTAGYHPSITCDVELDPAKVAAGRLARVEAQTSVPLREMQPQRQVPLWSGVLLFSGVGLLGLGWMIGRARHWRLRRPTGLLSVPTERTLNRPSSYTVIVAPTSMTGSVPDPAALSPIVPTVHVDTPGSGPTHSGTWEQRALVAEHRARQAEEVLRHGLLPHLSRWMREKLFRKLLIDRGQLLAAQEEATRKVMDVDARLNKLEVQMQQQTRVYVKRIEELTAELLAAKEENRELIRTKITQVKIEMEAARKRLLDQQSNTGGP